MAASIEILFGESHIVSVDKPGRLLSEILQQHGYMADLPCGGKGLCGKCRVRANGSLTPPTSEEQKALGEAGLKNAWRLACQSRVTGNVQVWPESTVSFDQILSAGDVRAKNMLPLYKDWGVAIDLGTTTLAAQLYGAEGLARSVSMKNPQTAMGADVITRIEKALAGEAEKLAQIVRAAVEQMLGSLCKSQSIEKTKLDAIVLTGNTAMLHLIAGRCVEPLSHAPFAAKHKFGEYMCAHSLFDGLREDAKIYFPTCISAFVGADITTAVLASGLYDTEETSLLVDIGTNGEIVLWHKGQLACCSTAAGPAFEGAGIRMGMYGIPGAIDTVEWADGKIKASTIGGKPAVGLCGSGIVDAAAVMLFSGVVDETGAFQPTGHLLESRVENLAGQAALRIAEEVYITERDIREVQLAKGSIRAGIETLLASAGVEKKQVKRLYVAGGFGHHLNLESAAAIGLLPRELVGCASVIGNAALTGAALLLQSTPLITLSASLAQRACTVAMDGNPLFVENYMQSMLFEDF